MKKNEIDETRKALIRILSTVKCALEKEYDSYILLEGDFIVLADIRNLLHLANAGDTRKLSIMLNAYRKSRKHGDSQERTMEVLDEVIEQDR